MPSIAKHVTSRIITIFWIVSEIGINVDAKRISPQNAKHESTNINSPSSSPIVSTSVTKSKEGDFIFMAFPWLLSFQITVTILMRPET